MFVQPIQHKTVLFGPKLVLNAKVILTFSSFFSCISLNIQHLREKKVMTNPDKSNDDSYSACVHTHAKTDTVNV